MDEEKVPELSQGNLAKGARVKVSSVYKYSGVKITDGDLANNSRWAASNYMIIELDRVATLNRVKLFEDIVHGERISSYAIEYWDGDEWQERWLTTLTETEKRYSLPS